MSRYFFHSQDGGAYLDPEGVELPDAGAARKVGTRYLAELLLDATEAFWRSGRLEVTVADQTGQVICKLTLIGQDAVAQAAE